MTLNPPTQYADDRNLRARQRLWELQDPPFDIVGWVLETAGVATGQTVLDVGCGNGAYLRGLVERGVDAIGCDLSIGMLAAVTADVPLTNADVCALSFRDDAADVVLAPHMLYHVPDRLAAARELRRVLRSGGVCVAVTNGDMHMRALRDLVEAAAREATPGWEMLNPATHAFSLQNGQAQLEPAFASVHSVRPEAVAPVRITDADVVADDVASAGDHYEDGVDRPWAEIVEHVRAAVTTVIDTAGAFVVHGEVGAFVCR